MLEKGSTEECEHVCARLLRYEPESVGVECVTCLCEPYVRVSACARCLRLVSSQVGVHCYSHQLSNYYIHVAVEVFLGALCA